MSLLVNSGIPAEPRNEADASSPSGENDFIDSGDVITQSDLHAEAKHQFRISKDFILIDDTQSPGELLFSLELSPLIDPTMTEMAKAYEHFTFKDIEVSMDATSPFGTASGAFQTAWITDPANTALGQADPTQKAASLVKVIRQEGSKLVRPRNSELMKINVEGDKYCLKGNDPRLSNFGTIVAVIRAPPATGDTAAFAVTVVGTIVFKRATVSAGATLASTTVKVDKIGEFKLNGENLEAVVSTIDDLPAFGESEILFDVPLDVMVDFMAGNWKRSVFQSWEKAQANALGMRDGKIDYLITLPLDKAGGITSLVDAQLESKPSKFYANYLIAD